MNCYRSGHRAQWPDVRMRMSLLLRLVLAAAGVLLADASISVNVDTDKIVSDGLGMWEREREIAGVESSLLSMLGFARRPKPQGPAHVPESLKKLFHRQKRMGMADIAKRGIHTRSANTVRSFPHVG